MKKSDIRFSVTLDDTNKPEAIEWNADDSGLQGNKSCKAILISVWDGTDQSTLRIDLWTKEMMVEEMQHLFYETLRSMGDTYLRATNDQKISNEITEFAKKFGKMTEVIK